MLLSGGKHGMPPNNADKRKAVTTMLGDPEWSAWSDRVIAKKCYVGNKLVGDVRRSLCSEHSEDSAQRTYTSKHGTQATMNTGGQKAARAAGPATLPDHMETVADRRTCDDRFHAEVQRLARAAIEAAG